MPKYGHVAFCSFIYLFIENFKIIIKTLNTLINGKLFKGHQNEELCSKLHQHNRVPCNHEYK